MRISIYKCLTLLLLIAAPFFVSAQKKGKTKTKNSGVTNLRNFDRQKVHFGFSLGYNKAGYGFNNNLSDTTLKILEITPNPGFNIGLIAVYHISENVKLKFMPDISFQRRVVEYTFDTTNYIFQPREFFLKSKAIESTVIEFPLTLKLRTNRIGNFAAAILVGGKYSIDTQSQKDVIDRGSDPYTRILKANDKDLSAELGVGLDFFLQYFKFGLELKYAHGFNDMLIHDNSIYSNPLDYLQSRMWTFNITFEGSW